MRALQRLAADQKQHSLIVPGHHFNSRLQTRDRQQPGLPRGQGDTRPAPPRRPPGTGDPNARQAASSPPPTGGGLAPASWGSGTAEFQHLLHLCQTTPASTATAAAAAPRTEGAPAPLSPEHTRAGEGVKARGGTSGGSPDCPAVALQAQQRGPGRAPARSHNTPRPPRSCTPPPTPNLSVERQSADANGNALSAQGVGTPPAGGPMGTPLPERWRR
ncbi:proline-rich protein 2-like [Harpia harpyja]|uniref:proline-rich protein 2-like n=1 Tax=Harpia harpyja TaxID=202280 RepID=UPI0022B20AE8|nr:proline-rich protein 2-like [Harpia harpyja]